MNPLCFIQGHSPAEDQVWNRGYSFSKCRRCRCDLIRSDGEWDIVPRGHRVVWKGGRHEHSRRADYARNLPILYRDVRGGVPALWMGGWYKHVLALAGGATSEELTQPTAALRDARREPKPYPFLLALAAVAGAGIQLILARPRRR
jgi:hypothetical protein